VGGRYSLRLPHLEADEAGELDTGLLQDLADGLLAVLGEGLLEQDRVLEEAVDPTLDDLREGGLGLALLLGRGLGDLPLLGDDVLGDLGARDVGRGEGGDVLRDVLGDSGCSADSSTSTPSCGGRSGLVRCR
jgi:hypothetical protein